MKKSQRIGEQLVSAGVVTQEQLEQAFAFQKEVGGTLGEVLDQARLRRAGRPAQGARGQQGLGWVNLAQVEIPREVLALLKHESVRARRMLPISREGRELVLGMVDPTDFQAIEEAQFQSGCTVRPVIMSTAQFEQALEIFAARGYATAPLRLGEEARARDARGERHLQPAAPAGLVEGAGPAPLGGGHPRDPSGQRDEAADPAAADGEPARGDARPAAHPAPAARVRRAARA